MIYKCFETQMKKINAKDWVTTILADIQELGLNVKIADIKTMKKGTYMNMVKQSINKKAFQDLGKN